GRHLQGGRAAPGHVVAGLRPRLQHAAVFQQMVRLQRGRKTDASLPADLAQRGRSRSDGQRTFVYQRGYELSDLLVAIVRISAHQRSSPRSINSAAGRITVTGTISMICSCYELGTWLKRRVWQLLRAAVSGLLWQCCRCAKAKGHLPVQDEMTAM